jgi:hypothetical protein
MSGNSGEQLLKIFVKIAIFIVKLIPGLVRLIIRGVTAIINMFRKKENVSEVPEQ